VALLVR